MCGMVCGVCSASVPGRRRPRLPESFGTKVGVFLVVVSNFSRSCGNTIIFSVFCEGVYIFQAIRKHAKVLELVVE